MPLKRRRRLVVRAVRRRRRRGLFGQATGRNLPDENAMTIYAAALNFAATYSALEPRMREAPYNAPPRAPVLYIKPARCVVGSGDAIPCPREVPALRMGGTLAVFIGEKARRVKQADALYVVSGYAVANDVSVPEVSYFRPAVAQRCRDGFCPLGAAASVSSGLDPDALSIRIYVNDALQAEANTSTLRRGVSRLIADVTEFMTLMPGDVLLVGEPANAPLARAGDAVRIEADGLPSLSNPLAVEVTD